MGGAGYNCGQKRFRGGRDIEKSQKSRSGSSRKWGKSLPTSKKSWCKGPEADKISKSSWVKVFRDPQAEWRDDRCPQGSGSSSKSSSGSPLNSGSLSPRPRDQHFMKMGFIALGAPLSLQAGFQLPIFSPKCVSQWLLPCPSR